MNKDERALLETLDAIVHSARVRERLGPIVERVRVDLAGKLDALMSWESVALETFDALPSAIASGWIFVLRAGADTGAERHPNSHQRMMTLVGTGDMKIDAKGTPNEVDVESEILWRSHLLVSEADAPVERRWISIPKNVWHRPVIPKGSDWVVVSFHTAAAEELIEERPGARQMLYLDEGAND
jgi:hypothetical protein